MDENLYLPMLSRTIHGGEQRDIELVGNNSSGVAV